jgi:hypothetical protein
MQKVFLENGNGAQKNCASLAVHAKAMNIFRACTAGSRGIFLAVRGFGVMGVAAKSTMLYTPLWCKIKAVR